MRFATLKKRRDFLKVRDDGKYQARRSFVIQYLVHPAKFPLEIKVGFTATKRIGNAVIRNRCKRRLRALIHHNMDRISKINQSMDLVLIARYITPDIDFETMNTELIDCLEKIFRDIKH